MARSRWKISKKKGFGIAVLLAGTLLIVLLAVGVVAWLVFTPYGPSTVTLVNVRLGSTTESIGRQLQAAGIVRSAFAFDLMRFWKNGTLKAGEYRFEAPATVPEIYGRIERGDVYTVSVTIPEGSNIFDIAARLQEAGIGTRQDFLQTAVKQVKLISDLDPKAKSLEGYLFPDTYRFSPNVTDAEAAATMVGRFRQVAEELELKKHIHRIVTIASLVERETAVPSERPLVASVFDNRLARHMPLMSDPSVIYGLELDGRWHGTIYKSDLTFNTPYNTYLHGGLPPGPICNPGIPSLRAAMHPAHTNYLYFVAASANPQGRSLFSTTLSQHDRNVAHYRKAVRQAGER
jgi:UPF0755 protein